MMKNLKQPNLNSKPIFDKNFNLIGWRETVSFKMAHSSNLEDFCHYWGNILNKSPEEIKELFIIEDDWLFDDKRKINDNKRYIK